MRACICALGDEREENGDGQHKERKRKSENAHERGDPLAMEDGRRERRWCENFRHAQACACARKT